MMLSSYQEQISLSKKTEVHEEELNLPSEEGLEDQSWGMNGVLYCLSWGNVHQELNSVLV